MTMFHTSHNTARAISFVASSSSRTIFLCSWMLLFSSPSNLVPSTHAFSMLGSNNAVSFFLQRTKRTPPPPLTLCFLRPTQGNQLIAAGTLAYDDNERDDAEESLSSLQQQNQHTSIVVVSSSAAVSLKQQQQSRRTNGISPTTTILPWVRRAWTTAQSLLRATYKALPTVRGWNWSPPYRTHNDSAGILFPVTGFAFVCDTPNHCRVVSTVANPSCRLPATAAVVEQQQQVLYGWYSPACPLLF